MTGDHNFGNEFNHFCTIGKNLAEEIPPNDLDPLHCMIPGSNLFEFQNVTAAELHGVIKSMKPSKSPGLDGIWIKLLKAAGNSIIDPLVYIFNLSLATGIFSDEMKRAKITFIHKSGDKTNCSNYRLVSVISAVAKNL